MSANEIENKIPPFKKIIEQGKKVLATGGLAIGLNSTAGCGAEPNAATTYDLNQDISNHAFIGNDANSVLSSEQKDYFKGLCISADTGGPAAVRKYIHLNPGINDPDAAGKAVAKFLAQTLAKPSGDQLAVITTVLKNIEYARNSKYTLYHDIEGGVDETEDFAALARKGFKDDMNDKIIIQPGSYEVRTTVADFVSRDSQVSQDR